MTDINETSGRKDDPIVTTTAGKVKGYLNQDQGIYTFKGLRYGESTAGEYRFRPPRKAESWDGIKDATEYGYSCPQSNMGSMIPPAEGVMKVKEPDNNEDCLFLNVWTPALTGKRPVMVWLHGKGFAAGSGSEPLYEGTRLSKRGDVVVATINHRLNVFGYLYLDEIGGEYFKGSGVAGMLDAVLALEWIRDNISYFGGDPDNVTIFGESGGGAKVSALLAMPSAKDLFHKGIIESGPGLNGTPAERGTEIARTLMLKLNIKDPKKLQEISVEEIQNAIAPPPGAPRLGGGMGFAPVVDGEYLPVHPFDPVAAPTASGKPILIGTNRDEMLLMNIMDPKKGKLTEEELIERIRPRTKEKTEEILAAYKKSRPDATPWDLLIAILTEPFRRRSIILAERQTATSSAPVYMYLFEFEVSEMMKAAHFMEVPLVFSNTHLTPGMRQPETSQVESQICDAWTAFARTGNPNHPGIPEWPAYTIENRATMIFDVESHVDNDPRREELSAWEGLGLEPMVMA